VPRNFILFLSDENAGGSGLHATIDENMWMSVVPPAMECIKEDATFSEYLKQGLRTIQGIKNKEAKKRKF
jgi:hypothetical protein